ncbi:uncharacterized protein [Penaeus vannamei]|uniref:uncharacterized protein isoform X2 n=1 Tax=Penaeus vannamei TaxID=6689 RepID=UPI00387F8F35
MKQIAFLLSDRLSVKDLYVVLSIMCQEEVNRRNLRDKGIWQSRPRKKNNIKGPIYLRIWCKETAMSSKTVLCELIKAPLP